MLGYHLRQFDRVAITAQFEIVSQTIRTLARRARLGSTAVDLAINEHGWLFYGDDATEMVTHTNPVQGTNLAFRSVTACILSPRLRLTIGVVPVWPENETSNATQLLEDATDAFDIRRVFLDRGFYEVSTLQLLELFDIECVV